MSTRNEGRAHRTPMLAWAFALLVGVAAPCAAHPTISVGYGWSTAWGPGGDALEHGRSYRIDLHRPSLLGRHWLLRATYSDFDRAPAWDRATSLMFVPALGFVPAASLAWGDLRSSTLEAGVQRSLEARGWRWRIEGTAGAGWTEYQGTSAGIVNDRRPDPLAVRRIERDVHPTMTLGTAIEIAGPWRTAWSLSAATQWMPARALEGPLVPLQLGARWPADPGSRAGNVANATPVLRFGAGVGDLQRPARLRDSMDPGLAMNVGFELPIRAGIALSLEAEHVTQRDEVALMRQVRDEFGNVIEEPTGQSVPLSLTATAVTAGFRARLLRGPIAPYARAGCGWGRTGGFGFDVATTSGAYLDENGNWIPVESSLPVGAGAPADGFAWSASLGFEALVFGAASAFLEGAAVGLHLSNDDLLVLPVRAGIALR